MDSDQGIDNVAMQQFLTGCSQQISVADSGVQLNGDSLGYAFSWGFIIEQQVQHYVVWGFHFAGGPALEIDFNGLAAHFDCTTQSILSVLGLSSGWLLYLNTSTGTLTQFVHFNCVGDARAWVFDALLPVIFDRLVGGPQPLGGG